MPTAHKIAIGIILVGLLGLAVDYTLELRDRLTLANEQVSELGATIKMQSALNTAMVAVSTVAINSKQDLQDDENNTKQVVRTIIKNSDCVNTLVPEPAVNRLREYADRIRNPASTDRP